MSSRTRIIRSFEITRGYKCIAIKYHVGKALIVVGNQNKMNIELFMRLDNINDVLLVNLVTLGILDDGMAQFMILFIKLVSQ